MSLRRIFITTCLLFIVIAGLPARASADWLFTPFVGMNFGGSVTFSDEFGDF
jgi:hypothetical protein